MVIAGAPPPPPAVAGEPRPARRGERGQALMVGLVVLFVAALAASLIAADLTLRERAMRDEAVRMHLRTLLDGELATALGRMAATQSQPSGRRTWGGGAAAAEREWLGGPRYRLTVWAAYAGHEAAAVAEVQRPPHGPPRVTDWRRLPAAATPPMPR